MKNIVSTTLILLSAFTFLAAQNANPNADFETWTHVTGFTAYDNPNSWNTLNATTAAFGVITCYKATANGEFHAGAAALKLITKNVIVQVAQGIATTGTLNTTTQVITGGIPYTGQPDSIVGWYRCTPVNGDAGFVQFMLLGAFNDTIGYAKFFAPTSASTMMFTRFAEKIVYSNTNTPVTSQWIISSSAGNTGQQINASIWVDDLDFVFNSSSVQQAELESGIKLYPNPIVDHTLTISNDKNKIAVLTIYDVMGKSYGTFNINNKKTLIDVAALAAGTYMYSIVDKNGDLILSSNFIIAQ